MKGKLQLRFLQPGLVEVDPPENYETMTKAQIIQWATEKLEGLTDEVILDALSDFDKNDRRTFGYFDTDPLLEAVELDHTNEEPLCVVQTASWRAFTTNQIWVDPET